MEEKKALEDNELENVSGGMMDLLESAMKPMNGMIDQDDQCGSIKVGPILPVKGINKQVNTAKNVIREY